MGNFPFPEMKHTFCKDFPKLETLFSMSWLKKVTLLLVGLFISIPPSWDNVEWTLRAEEIYFLWGKNDHLKSLAPDPSMEFPLKTPSRERPVAVSPKRPADLWSSQENPNSQAPSRYSSTLNSFYATLSHTAAFRRESTFFK